ncbi:hypothetical protein K1719_038599 [Acacia pycnantha]|nr:hypothetical protein K1719_038599 [Acacia pycnantha]
MLFVKVMIILEVSTAFFNTNQTIYLQRLTWNALKSAGTPRSSLRFHSNDETKKGLTHNRTQTTEQYKDRIDTLLVVSTLIITTSFAAGFTIPGDVDHGIPVLLNRHLFHLFILSLTFSLFGAISSTIILLWARLGISI